MKANKKKEPEALCGFPDLRRHLLHCRLHARGGSLVPHNQRKCTPAKMDAQKGATAGQEQVAIVHSRKTEALGLRRRKPQLGVFADFRHPQHRLLHDTGSSLIIS
jgi:hypothetical protein